MDFSLTEEQKSWQKKARKFAEEEIYLHNERG